MQAIILSTIMMFFTLVATDETTVTGASSLKGIVTDAATGDPIVFGNVSIYKNGIAVTGAQTDLNGEYHIPDIEPGTYDVEASYIGYEPERKEEIVLKKGQGRRLNFTLKVGTTLDEVVVFGKGNKRSEMYRVDGIRTSGQPTTMELSSVSAGVNPSGSYRSRNIEMEFTERNWNTEDYDVIVENTFQDPGLKTYSTFSIDTDGASYSNLRRMLRNGQTPPVDAVRIEEMVNYFDYAYDQPAGNVPFEIITELGSCPWNEAHQLVHIGIQGLEIPTDDLPASNLVFLLDVSGSMDAPNKLPLVKQSFKMLTGQLREKDRVAIVVYAGGAGVVLPSTPGNETQSILEAIDRLQAGGGTSGAEGIRLAYEMAESSFIKGGNNRVILATDGDFNIGVSSDAELVRLIEGKRDGGVFLSVLGYGMGNYKDNKMQKLANHGNGNHSYIDDITEAKKVFVNEFGGTLFTIAKDVKIQVEFNPEEVAAYRLIGYENRMLAAEDFNDDKKDAGEIGSGHTVTALYEVIPVGVESDFLRSVDKPRFSKEGKTTQAGKKDGNLMHLKVRYKETEGDTSSLVEQYVRNESRDWKDTSDNFRWSAAVASFGMMLRGSEFKGYSNTDLVLELAEGALGTDEFGYRSEFIRLVRGFEPILAMEEKR